MYGVFRLKMTEVSELQVMSLGVVNVNIPVSSCRYKTGIMHLPHINQKLYLRIAPISSSGFIFTSHLKIIEIYMLDEFKEVLYAGQSGRSIK